MWVRLFKTNRNEVHAVVQVPKVMNSFINDLWILKKVHCLYSYVHKFQLLETMKKATFEHKVDRIIIPLRNPYDRFWDGITVAGRDSMLELKEENAKYTGIVNDNDPDALKVSATGMIPMMINAIKELSTRVTALEAG